MRTGLATVADAMVTDVKLTDAAGTVRDLRELFDDEHVHAAVVVVDGLLVGVVDREDLEAPLLADTLAVRLASREGRTVAPGTDLAQAHAVMLATGRRRLAVVDEEGVLLGLLCLKRTRAGFCSDADVAARSCA